MSPSARAEDPLLAEELLASVAQEYYLNDESKVAIAKARGLSRFQVARLLQRAREQGVVRIEVRSAGGVNVGLSGELRDALGLEAAWVVDAGATGDPVDLVGATMARVLAKTLRDGDVVGVNWSRALVAMTEHLDGLPSCAAVQLAGHAGVGAGFPDAAELVRRLARASGGEAYTMPAPLLVPDQAALRSLLGQSAISAAAAMFDAVDVAVLSVGAWLDGESAVHAAASERDRARALDLGVVGEVGGRLFDRHGNPVESVLGDLVLGIQRDQLTRVPRRVAGTFGAARAEATVAAVRAGYVNELVVDRALAQAVLGER